MATVRQAGSTSGGAKPAASGFSRRRFAAGLAAAPAVFAAGCRAGSPAPSGVGGPLAQATPGAPIPGFGDPDRWAGRTLVAGGWGGAVQDAVREAVWQPFATATGCELREVATDYGRLQRAVAAGEFYADLLLVDPIWAVDALDRGLITPIPAAAIDPTAAEPFPGGEGTIPAFAYALVSAYRRDAIAADGAPGDWAAWWDTNRYPGPRALSRDPFGSFEFALLADGVAPETLYPLDGERAIARLRQISGTIVDRWWDSGAQPVAWLGSERADLASAWHYRVVAGQWEGYAVDLVWSQGLLVVDRWAMPVGGREPEVAADLLRFSQLPQIQAALAERVPLGPTHPGALALLDPMVVATLPTGPLALPQLVRADAGWWAAHRGEAVERMNSWLLGTPGA